MGKLENKVVLVTGGTTGIGLAAARLFAAEGAKVTVTGSNPKTLAVAREELKGVAEVIASDAGSEADILDLAKRFAGGIDVVYLNAGIAKLGPMADLDLAAMDETYRLNVRGPWLAIKHLAPVMRSGGSFVVTGSINGLLGMPGSSVYGSSKAALRQIVRTAANELASKGIRVNSVAPGPIETPLYGKLGFSQEATKGMASTLINKIPLARFGTADEVAKAALFLASSDSSFMTGEEIVLDGGMTRV